MEEILLEALAAMTLLEAVSVLLGFAYAILAVRRTRWCWVAGGLSSVILIYLSIRARLPMQSALQAYYVAMAIYGFWRWSRWQEESALRVSTWPLRAHIAGWTVVLALSAASAHWLASETQAAWPFLDSATTWGGLLATWLAARMKLENWLYWIIIDTVLAFLFAAQGLYLVALLFVSYLVIAIVGFVSWQRILRAQSGAIAVAS